MTLTLDAIRRSLAEHRPHAAPPALSAPPTPRVVEAAVALVLAGGPELSMCVIQRAERAGDPWSGHLALPGGRASAADPHPRAVAERETFEEVGLALGDDHWLGGLSHLPVRLGAVAGDMVLHSFVYYLGEELAPFGASDEVAAAFWVPLTHLWDPRNATHVEWERDGSRLRFPAIGFRGRSIWGLTFRVLTLFSDAIDAPLPHFEESPRADR